VKRAAWLAGAAVLLTWLPLTIWRGLAQGRAFRIGAHGQDSIAPLIEGMIQVGFAMIAPALFAGLLVFALLAWREERRIGR
jgi:hypothetical protein